MLRVSFVVIILVSLTTGILHKTSISDAPTHSSYNSKPKTIPISPTSNLSAISNNHKLHFRNKFHKIITLKNDNGNQNMIYATPIYVPQEAYNDIEKRARDNTRLTERIFNQNRHTQVVRTSSYNGNQITQVLLPQTNNSSSINNNNNNNNNYVNKNGNKNNNHNYDKRADNNYVIKNDTNLSFSHNYPIIDFNYKDDADDYHKNVEDASILSQQQQHNGIYDNIKLGGIYDYHPPPNPLLQVLFSRYGRHLPNSYFHTTRNYGYYAYGAGNDINNNLPNGGYKIEMEFDSNK